MKGKVKNFFLCNAFNLILLAGLLGVYIHFIVEEINPHTHIYSDFRPYSLIIYIITTVIHFVIMALPIAFVFYKIIKSRNDTFEPYGISMYIIGRVLVYSFLTIIYFFVFILLRWAFILFIFLFEYFFM